jgi:hypothetical protein
MSQCFTSKCMVNAAWWWLVLISSTVCAKSMPRDSAMCLECCYWLHNTRQLLSLILFTDEATFICNRVNNTCNSHWWSRDNPHSTVEKNFQRHFSINVRCGMIEGILIGPVIFSDHMTGPDFCKRITTTRGCSFGYMDCCYVLSAWRSPLFIIPNLWSNISWHLSYGGSVVAEQLTVHQDLQT